MHTYTYRTSTNQSAKIGRESSVQGPLPIEQVRCFCLDQEGCSTTAITAIPLSRDLDHLHPCRQEQRGKTGKAVHSPYLAVPSTAQYTYKRDTSACMERVCNFAVRWPMLPQDGTAQHNMPDKHVMVWAVRTGQSRHEAKRGWAKPRYEMSIPRALPPCSCPCSCSCS